MNSLNLNNSHNINSNGGGGGAVDLQEKIAAARREADQLKDQIRARKDKLADTSRE